MGNKNEGYLGGIMGGESRVLSGATTTVTTGTQKTVQDLTLQSDLSLVGDKVDKGATNGLCDAYFPVSSGSGYQYLEVRYNADSTSRKWSVLGLIKAANVETGTYGNDANSYVVRMDNSALRRGAAGTTTATSVSNNSLDYIFGLLLNRATGDVYISVCDPGSAPVWVREDNTESTTFDVANPTFSGLDLATFDTLYAQINYDETYMNFNFGGNPLFDAEETSGNDSSTWYNDPPVSVVSFGRNLEEVALKVANTGILSLEEAGTQTVGDLTLGDDNWNDVTLLLDGSSATTDLSSVGNTITNDTGVSVTSMTGPYGSTQDVLSFDGVSDTLTFDIDSTMQLAGDFTVEAWVNRASAGSGTSDRECLWSYWGDGTDGTRCALQFEKNTNAVSFYDNANHLDFTISGTNAFVDDTWFHIAIVRSGSTYECFVDGVSVGTNTGTTTTFTGGTAQSNKARIGALVVGSIPFVGEIADFRVTQGVARYTSNFTPPTASFPTSLLPVGGTTLPQLSWGGITGRSVLTEGSAGNYINPTDHFKAVTWTADGTTAIDIAGVGFQPDLVWMKSRSAAYNHHLHDSVRGTNKFLDVNEANPENTTSTTSLTSYNPDGFTLGTGSNGNYSGTGGTTHVAWCLKAGGTGVSNTDGSITSTVSANVDAGFSVVTYTGTGAVATVGHGLTNAPELILGKRTTGTTAPVLSNWFVGGSILGTTETLYLNLANKTEAYTGDTVRNEVTSTTFRLGTDTNRNKSSETHVAYCFHSVPGFSKVGSYTGDGGTSNSVALGFRPAFVLVKRTDVADDWIVLDNARDTTNPRQTHLYANEPDIEGTTAGLSVDFDDTGFTLLGAEASINATNGDYIYLAFAESHNLAATSQTLVNTGIFTLEEIYEITKSN